MEDNAIIALYLRRSEEALTASEDKYGHYCSVIARNILRSAEDAEECVSDTWLRAWNVIPPTIPRILKAFFGKITRNLSLNRLERETAGKRGGGEVLLALEELEECVADRRVASWSAEGAVIREVLDAFLQDLSKEKRIIFVRRYFYLEPVATIAGAMGCGESRIKMILMRARKDLAERLLKEGIRV